MKPVWQTLIIFAVLGAFGAHGAVIGADNRLAPAAFWASTQNKIAPLCGGPPSTLASGEIRCDINRKINGQEQQFLARGTAQLVLESNKLLTSAHVFIEEDGSPVEGLSHCEFIPFGHPELSEVVDLTTLRLLPHDLKVTASDFWRFDVATVRLLKSSKITPYGLAASSLPGSPGMLIALDSTKGFDFALNPGMQECTVHDRENYVTDQAETLFTDCDTLDVTEAQGGGPSGAAFLIWANGRLNVSGILRGEYHSLPTGAGYSQLQHSTVFVGLSPVITAWIATN